MSRNIFLTLWFFFLLSGSIQTECPGQDFHFDYLTAKNGLSQNTVNCIFQDSKGFIWIGTQDGLNKYDGYSFEIFKYDQRDPHSLSHNWIWDIYEDLNGKLWIATWNGLNRYDPEFSIFDRFYPDRSDKYSISNSRPTSITGDEKGNLWIGTWGGGLNLLDTSTGQFFAFQHDSLNQHSISSNFIRTLFLDQSRILWIGSWNGLCSIHSDSLLNGKNHFFQSYLNDPDEPFSISGNKIFSISEDSRGNLWVGTYSSGVNIMNRFSGVFTHFQYDPRTPGTLSSNSISKILEDSSGKLWIATSDQGLNLFNPVQINFTNIKSHKANQFDLNSNRITSIYEDRSGVLWIGTYTAGLNKLNLYGKKFIHYFHNEEISSSLSSNLVRCFYRDEQGYMWIGTEDNGLNRLDFDSNSFRHFSHDPSNPNSISHDNVQTIVGDGKGNLWIGTSGGGLNRFDTASKKFTHFKNIPGNNQSIAADEIEVLFLDRRGLLWIGTSDNGLDRYDPVKNLFEHFSFSQSDSNSISSNYILSLFQDSRGNMWIGGWGGGLNRYDDIQKKFIRYIHNPMDEQSLCDNIVNSIFETEENGRPVLWVGTSGGLSYMYLDEKPLGKFHHLFEYDGLPNQHIYGILKDRNGYLWLSTNKGLSRYKPFESFKNYDDGDGLLIEEFSGGAYYCDAEGRMYFGSSHGFVCFDPDSIRDKTFIPPLVITSFKKFNKEVKLPQQISAVNELNLSHNDYVFSFEFASLDFSAPMKNMYAYRMDGFNKKWIYTRADQRTATFTNLNPGSYTFRVKGTNSDGLWNESGVSIKIIIAPPYWKTWWFKSSIALLLFSGLVTAHWYRVEHLKRAKNIQEEFSSRLLDFQEKERKRIAAEIHDSLGQNLLIINSEIQQFNRKHLDLAGEFVQMEQIIQESINEARDISHNLHPHILDKLGLKKAIESLINRIERTSEMKFELKIDSIEDMLAKSSQIHIYRIIQEGINNIIKHAFASRVDIRIAKVKNRILLSIRDNGRGFLLKGYKEKGTSLEGMGIADIRERVRVLGGELKIISHPGKGTKIEVNIPAGKFQT